jgi:hypothetical protein
VTLWRLNRRAREPRASRAAGGAAARWAPLRAAFQRGSVR